MERFRETFRRNSGLQKLNNFDSKKVAFILLLDVLCATVTGRSIPERGKMICSSSEAV